MNRARRWPAFRAFASGALPLAVLALAPAANAQENRVGAGTPPGVELQGNASTQGAQRSVVLLDFDIDGNGVTDALTDGLLALRYLFGFRGGTLVTGAVGTGCTRCDAPAIEAYLAGIAN